MSRWYAPSLLPILLLAASLAAMVSWRDRRQWPIAAYCASLAAWSAAIWLAARPDTEALGERAMMVGFFIPATFLHVAARDLGWDRRVVGAVYAAGLAMTLTGAASPNLYLADGGTRPGPLFAPMFAATVLAGGVPLFLLWRGPDAPARRERRRYLRLAGAAMAAGGAVQVGSMLAHAFYPLGLYLLSVSVSLMTYVAQADPLPAFGRFVERTQRYALLAALLSAVWMLGLVGVVQLGGGWTWEAAPLLFVLTLTAQPLLTEARIGLAARVFPGAGDADGLTRALVDSEARAEHALRLAEIGTMASAVAHEVRNPLGVITACTAVLERTGADAEVLAEIRDQVARAARFADELLEYGRPSAPRWRRVSLADAARLAGAEVERALAWTGALEVEGDAEVDADLAQVVRLFGILIENAALSTARRVVVTIEPDGPDRVRCRVDDDGTGVPAEIAGRLFAPFVSGRGRAGPRPGTGLGLAIAQGIAARHRGALTHDGAGALGGARFGFTTPTRGGP